MSTSSRSTSAITQIRFQKAIKLRNSGLSVHESCSKAQLPIPTFYYQLRKTGLLPTLAQRRSGFNLEKIKPPLTGFEVRKLRTAAARIQKLGHQIEQLLTRL